MIFRINTGFFRFVNSMLLFLFCKIPSLVAQTILSAPQDRVRKMAQTGVSVLLWICLWCSVVVAKAQDASVKDSLVMPSSTFFPKKSSKALFRTSTTTTYSTKQVNVRDRGDNGTGIGSLVGVEGVAMYEGKKTEVIRLDDITANKAANTARQVFAKVAGLNIWENDGSGLQLNIGARGLSPNRTANFNTRQNGYDIAADPLGYPESYYTPPIEALEKIEVVRGAASLQYGTQFGGMINFVFRRGAEDKPIEVSSRLTGGSFGFFNSFTTIGGTLPLEKLGNINYTALYQFKRGDGWRPNSGFYQHQAFASVRWEAARNLMFTGEYTFMHYEAQQPGGLTDAMFEQNPQQSVRARNWFQVNWNLFALTMDYSFSATTRLQSRSWATLTGRDALGIFERINVIDFGNNRTMIRDVNQNLGNETRFVHTYSLFDNAPPSTVLAGVRLFRGTTTKQQGEADNSTRPHFTYLNPSNLENSDYLFPSTNVAAFAEHIFAISPELSITPGVRWEMIGTFGDGYFKNRVFDFAGNVVAETRTNESIKRERSFLLAGVGVSFKPRIEPIVDAFGETPVSVEIYGNFSQNYRAIEFSDVRIVNPNAAVNPNLQDERGFNADVGVRGRVAGVVYWDVSAFFLSYAQRIGWVLKSDAPPLFLPYRYRTNVADSRTLGVESLVDVDVWKWLVERDSPRSISVFVNSSFTEARYINTGDLSILNKEVELVPPVMVRTGVTWREMVLGGTQLAGMNLAGTFQATVQYSSVARQFTDATNAVRTSTAVNGIIPSYAVWDCSVSYRSLGDGVKWTLEAGVNNVLDARYFTRRADGYPGPGIIPAEARSFYGTFGIVF
jgi:Fe(3+) dicitrate transport protein